ncbi:MAG TPA: penicillin-insensitive murein endopeptidase [Chthoniobacterales bacterium]|nr:penicillin-insensitive murein endopeptidase [Chthoniobacterales bacterium]
MKSPFRPGFDSFTGFENFTTPEWETSEDFEGEAADGDRPKEACGCRKCREVAEHEDSRNDIARAIQELEADFEWEDEGGWASQYAPDVRQAIDLGGAMWPLALQRAIQSGIRDPNALANIAFYMQFPARNGRPISAAEPGATELIAAWKFFRDSAKNMLPAPPSAPAASCGKTIPQVNVLMPESAPGLEAKKPASHRYGLPETIAALKEIGRRWQATHPSDPPVRIRDISRCGGGKFPPHDSHRMGIDVDIGLMRNDGLSAAVNFKTQPTKYSRRLTQEMVDTIRTNGLLKVHRLWFSDRAVTNVNHDNIHNNHVHVRFCLPSGYDLAAMKRAAYPGGTKGAFATCT